MGKHSGIEWCDHTFNPWLGCSKVSEGCAHCYAERELDLRFKRVKWGERGMRQKTGDSYWRGPLSWNRAAREAGQVATVFAGSHCDVFEAKADQPELDSWRRDLLSLIIDTPWLTWLLLTKHVARVAPTIESLTGFSDVGLWWPRNCWIGTSVENQARAQERIPQLLRLPGKKFVSLEPLLGPVDLLADFTWLVDGQLDWIIVGGESGPGARPMDPTWVANIRDQAYVAGVPFFFKQWGAWVPYQQAPAHKGGELRPAGKAMMRRVGKKRAGASLAGTEWRELPKFGPEGGSW